MNEHPPVAFVFIVKSSWASGWLSLSLTFCHSHSHSHSHMPGPEVQDEGYAATVTQKLERKSCTQNLHVRVCVQEREYESFLALTRSFYVSRALLVWRSLETSPTANMLLSSSSRHSRRFVLFTAFAFWITVLWAYVCVIGAACIYNVSPVPLAMSLATHFFCCPPCDPISCLHVPGAQPGTVGSGWGWGRE